MFSFHVAVTTVALSSDCQRLAAGCEFGSLFLCNTSPRSAALSSSRAQSLKGHSLRVYSVSFSPDCGPGKPLLLASGSWDGTVRLWDCERVECVGVLNCNSWVNCVVFSPDGSLLASACNNNTARLWDVADRSAGPVLQGHTNAVRSVSFSPHGTLLASGSMDSTVRLWHLPDGSPGPVQGHVGMVWCVAFSPISSSNLLASCSKEKTIRLWDVSSNQLVRVLDSHMHPVRSVAFSPDGRKLASGSEDKTVKLWSVASSKVLKTLRGHTEALRSVVFHPNGLQVVSASFDNTVRVWAVCEWSDRTHYMFGAKLKALVFTLMCVKQRLDNQEEQENGKGEGVVMGLPRLPMVMWLEVFHAVQTCVDE
jgi:WD40 repeat protein